MGNSITTEASRPAQRALTTAGGLMGVGRVRSFLMRNRWGVHSGGTLGHLQDEAADLLLNNLKKVMGDGGV